MLPPREDFNSGLVRMILKTCNSDDSMRGKLWLIQGSCTFYLLVSFRVRKALSVVLRCNRYLIIGGYNRDDAANSKESA